MLSVFRVQSFALAPGRHNAADRQPSYIQVVRSRRKLFGSPELKTVEMSLIPGRSYQWFIEDEEKEPLSDRYRFRVLSMQESYNIGNQLAEIKKQYAEYAPELCQALYLQLLSDAESGLDFYADSLRILEPYSKKAVIPDSMIEQLHGHCISE